MKGIIIGNFRFCISFLLTVLGNCKISWHSFFTITVVSLGIGETFPYAVLRLVICICLSFILDLF